MRVKIKLVLVSEVQKQEFVSETVGKRCTAKPPSPSCGCQEKED
jgi:hypothetical protein